MEGPDQFKNMLTKETTGLSRELLMYIGGLWGIFPGSEYSDLIRKTFDSEDFDGIRSKTHFRII